ncbi:glycoside hydrolase N-terminal domain-containing protein, partial [Porphyromonas loveana]
MIRPMRYTLLLIFLLLAVRPLAAQTDNRHRFHFTEPACVWEEQLPLGNGRIGLMSDGRPTDETITL